VTVPAGHQRTATKIKEDLRSRQTPEFLTRGLPKATSEVELRTGAGGVAEAHIHQYPYVACTTATKLIIKPKIALSTSTPNEK
jgi:hypothetical protein